MEFVLFKSNCQKCYHIYPTGRQDDQFLFCRKRYIADGTTASPTLAFPRPNESDVNEWLSSGRQKCGSHKGKELGWTEDIEVFPCQISEASSDWQYGDGCHHAKRMIPSDSIPGRFEFMARRQETNHASLLFFSCLHFQCWTNTLYTTLTSKATKEQLCGPVHFHYTCLLPYRSSIDV